MNEEINYRPADYKAIQDSAKEMSKQELEKEYVYYRNRKHIPIGAGIGLMILCIILIGGIYMLGAEEKKGDISKVLAENVEIIEEDICQYFPEGYKVKDLGGTSVDLVCEKQPIIQIECLD
jgi:hypothetical protein